MSLHASERETVITTTDDANEVRIWTAQRRHIGRLRRHPAYVEVAHGTHEGTEWAEFTIAAELWNPATGAKRARKPLTDEQRAAAGERLRKAREAGAEVPPWEIEEDED